MKITWPYAACAAAGAAAALLWPLSDAIAPTEASQLRVASAIVAAVVCLGGGLVRLRPVLWTGTAATAGMVGAVLLFLHVDARTQCLASYEGRDVVIGTEYLPELAAYLAANPGLSAADRLFDAGGVAQRVWTAGSIRTCGRLLGAAGTGAIPFLALAAAALLARQRHRFLPSPAAPRVPVGVGDIRAGAYDAFLSYRHSEPDKTYAMSVLELLEQRGLRVAIDFRDFAPNEHFLSEMERCITQSRFVLCIITAQYLQSDHTSEEAIISKTLDLAERRKRLVPLIFERVPLPVWLHGLVGIDFTPSAAVDPFERLHALLASPRSG